MSSPPVLPRELWRAWTFEPAVVAGLVLVLCWYGWGVWRVWRSAGRGHGVGWWRVTAFCAALLAIVIALISPLDALGDELFSAHMAQHLLLIVVAAPLLVLANPLLPFLWGLPRHTRRAIAGWWTSRRASALAIRWLTRTVGCAASAWLLHLGALFFWHAPTPYGWTLDHEAVHALEHVSFLATAVLFWWIPLGPAPRRRLGAGAAVLYVASAGALMSGLAALLTLSPTPWYAEHVGRTEVWHLSPLADQQLAGVLMWVPTSVVYLAAAGASFVRWLNGASSGGPTLRSAVRATLVVLVTVSATLLAGCDGSPAVATHSVAGGDATRGAHALNTFGCGTCHMIPGIPDAEGQVGPPLIAFGRRTLVAGRIPNTVDGLVAWIREPQTLVPGTAMPNLGVSERDARDMAAYLYTLR